MMCMMIFNGKVPLDNSFVQIPVWRTTILIPRAFSTKLCLILQARNRSTVSQDEIIRK